MGERGETGVRAAENYAELPRHPAISNFPPPPPHPSSPLVLVGVPVPERVPVGTGVPVLAGVAAGVAGLLGDTVMGGVWVDDGVVETDGEELTLDVSDDDVVTAGVLVAVDVVVTAAVPVVEEEGVLVPVGAGVRLPVPVSDGVTEPVLVIAGVRVLDAVTLDVLVAVGDTDGPAVLVTDAVPVDAGVTDTDGATVPLEEQDGHTGTAAYGAAVTPRNTVFVGAVATVALVIVAVLKEYSLDGEVAYSMYAPHAPSCRPAREMMAVPDSSSMEGVGVFRVQVVPTAV